MADDTKETPKKSSSTATIVKVVLLVAVVASVVSMYLHGQRLAHEHAKKVGKSEQEAGVLLPWHWTPEQWKSWVVEADTAAVSTAK